MISLSNHVRALCLLPVSEEAKHTCLFSFNIGCQTPLVAESLEPARTSRISAPWEMGLSNEQDSGLT